MILLCIHNKYFKALVKNNFFCNHNLYTFNSSNNRQCCKNGSSAVYSRHVAIRGINNTTAQCIHKHIAVEQSSHSYCGPVTLHDFTMDSETIYEADGEVAPLNPLNVNINNNDMISDCCEIVDDDSENMPSSFSKGMTGI